MMKTKPNFFNIPSNKNLVVYSDVYSPLACSFATKANVVKSTYPHTETLDLSDVPDWDIDSDIQHLYDSNFEISNKSLRLRNPQIELKYLNYL